MNNNKQEKPNSIAKRVQREQFYKKLSSQRKMLSQDIKDLRVLNTLKGGFGEQLEFDLSETDQLALDKHNKFMEAESLTKINTIQSDIRLSSAIARGKQ